MIRAAQERAIGKRYKEVAPVLDELGRRRFAAAEALALGRGGASLLAAIPGRSRPGGAGSTALCGCGSAGAWSWWRQLDGADHRPHAPNDLPRHFRHS